MVFLQLAKIYQQRNRRFKTSIENSVLNKTVKYDTCNITPGTILWNF